MQNTRLTTHNDLITVSDHNLPEGFETLSAWTEAPGRICVCFRMTGWSATECDFFGYWSEAVREHPVLSKYLVGAFPQLAD